MKLLLLLLVLLLLLLTIITSTTTTTSLLLVLNYYCYYQNYWHTYTIRVDAQLDVPGKLALVDVLILLQHLHVVRDMLAKDVVPVDLGVVLSTLIVVTWETLDAETGATFS